MTWSTTGLAADRARFSVIVTPLLALAGQPMPPFPSRIARSKHVFIPHRRHSGGGLGLHRGHLLGGFAGAGPPSGRPGNLREFAAMRGAAAGQRRLAVERGNAALAAEHFLDAAGDGVHAVDDWAI